MTYRHVYVGSEHLCLSAQLDRAVCLSVIQAILNGAMAKNTFFRAEGHVYLSAEKWKALEDHGRASREMIMQALFVQSMNPRLYVRLCVCVCVCVCVFVCADMSCNPVCVCVLVDAERKCMDAERKCSFFSPQNDELFMLKKVVVTFCLINLFIHQKKSKNAQKNASCPPKKDVYFAYIYALYTLCEMCILHIYMHIITLSTASPTY
jgi:hypothetical protein